MLREFMLAKLHRVTVTEANLDYVGSITIDLDLLDASGILPMSKVDVLNITNGSRLSTYVIAGERGSGVVCLNGAAAHLFGVGDLAIIIAYAVLGPDEWEHLESKTVLVDGANRVTEVLLETV